MSEAIADTGSELTQPSEILEAVQDADAPQLSKHEQRALEQGWKPKEKFEGDPDDFIDAREFLRRGELFDHISKLNKKIKDQEKAIDSIMDHTSKVKEASYKKAMEELQMRQRQAIQHGDVDKATQLTDEIVQLKEDVAKNATVHKSAAQLAAEDFVSRNSSWFKDTSAESKAMQTFAQAKADEIGIKRPELSPEEVFELTEKEVKSAFRHRFEQPVAHVVSAVAPPARGGKTNLYEGLSPDRKKEVQLWQRNGKMDEAQIKAYIERCKLIDSYKGN